MAVSFKITYFLKGRPIGGSILNVDSELQKPHSIAFFCSWCGDIWGRVFVEKSPDCWELYNRPCEKHKPQFACEDRMQPPGSLAGDASDAAHVGCGGWAGTFDAMPPEVREREAKLRGLL